MSRIPKWIYAAVVGAIILAAIIIGIFLYKNKTSVADESVTESEDVVTRAEWLEMISNDGISIDLDEHDSINTSENMLTQEALNDAAKLLGDEELSELIGSRYFAIEDFYSYAEDGEWFTEGRLEKGLLKEDALNILEYVKENTGENVDAAEYFEPEWADKIVDATSWNIVSFEDSNLEDEYSEITVSSENDQPKVGDIIVYQDQLGFSYAKKVVSVVEGDSNFVVALEGVNDLSEVMPSCSFAGYADFENAVTEDDITNMAMLSEMQLEPVVTVQNGKTYTATPVISKSGSTKAVNLKVLVSVDGDGVGSDILVNEKSLNNYISRLSVDSGIDVNELLAEGDSDGPFSKSASSTFSVSFNNLSLYAAGTWNEAGETSATVRVNSDVVFDVESSVEVSAMIPLASVPFPIPVTGGVITVKLIPYITFDAEGNVEITYTLGGCYAKATASSRTGLSKSVGHISADTSFAADATITLGAGVECAVVVLNNDKFTLFDPAIEIAAIGEAETLDVVKGYEDCDPCVEVGVRLPIVKFYWAKGDSLVGKVLGNFNAPSSIDIISYETAPLVKYCHAEFEPEKNMIMDPEGDASVCTHTGGGSDILKYVEELGIEKFKEDWCGTPIEKWKGVYTYTNGKMEMQEMPERAYQKCKISIRDASFKYKDMSFGSIYIGDSYSDAVSKIEKLISIEGTPEGEFGDDPDISRAYSGAWTLKNGEQAYFVLGFKNDKVVYIMVVF